MAAPAVSFALSAPASVASGGPFDITITALDPYGNTDTGYTGTVTFTTSDADAGVVLPADYTFQPTDGGAVTFAGGFTLVTPGDQTVTATDTASGINGSATVTVVGGLPPGGSGSPGGAFFVFAVAPVPATPGTPTRLTTRPAQAVPALEAAHVDRLFAAYQGGAAFKVTYVEPEAPNFPFHGAWSLDVHHTYDPIGHVLYLGDGSFRSVSARTPVIDWYANLGGNIAIGPDGSLYVSEAADYLALVQRVAPERTITTVAGNGTPGFAGDERGLQ
jgi:hypothetical protein